MQVEGFLRRFLSSPRLPRCSRRTAGFFVAVAGLAACVNDARLEVRCLGSWVEVRWGGVGWCRVSGSAGARTVGGVFAGGVRFVTY